MPQKNSNNILKQVLKATATEFNKQNKITQQLLNNLLSQIKNPPNTGQYLQSLISSIKSPPQTKWGKAKQWLLGGPDPYKAFMAYQKYLTLMSQIANSGLNQNQKNVLMQSLNNNYQLISQNVQYTGIAAKVFEEIQEDFAKGIMDVISGKGDFGDVLQNIGSNLGMYVLNNLMGSLQRVLTDPRTLQIFGNILKVGFSGASSLGKGLWGGFKAIKGLLHFHDGGIVPTGMNYSLPGTQEQLALLKGGERILSPSENTSYSDKESQQSSPIVVNNYTVKAWDSKDVSKYFLENKDVLNAITFDGIRRNSQQLRTMVQNA